MNPIVINTTNIKQFGFQVLFDLELRKLVFELTGTTIYQTGGAANIPAVCFEVIDPAGVTIAAINLNTPQIVPSTGGHSWELQLATGVAVFGKYLIRGVIKEANAQTYEVALPPKDVRMPKGYDATCMVPGTFKEVIDCQRPFIRLQETTPFVYMGRDPQVTPQVTGTLYYPRDVQHPEAQFTSTPFQTRLVYTGDYVMRNKTKAQYDLQDGFLVQVSYASTIRFDVTCLDRLCDVLCCIYEVQEQARKHCGDAKGQRAQEQLKDVAIPFFLAASKERCGKDASAEIKEIKEMLQCECNCADAGPRLIQPSLVSGSGSNFTFVGQAATDVNVDVNDNVTIHTRNVSVLKLMQNDTAFDIRRTQDADNTNFAISFNYAALSTTILNTIQGNTQLLTLLNSLIATTGISAALTGLDGKCVLDTIHYDFTLLKSLNSGATFVSITIDGTEHVMPNGTAMTEIEIAAWLNGLNLGDFEVVITQASGPVGPGAPKSYLVRSTANAASVQFMTMQDYDSDTSQLTAPFNVNFIRNSKTLLQVIQAMIDYLCALDTMEVKLGRDDLRTYLIQGNGSFSYSTYGPSTPLGDFLLNVSASISNLMLAIMAAPKVDCDTLKQIFPLRINVPFSNADQVFGQKNGQCSALSLTELAMAIINVVQTDQGVKDAFCAINCTVPVPNVCATPEAISMTTVVE